MKLVVPSIVAVLALAAASAERGNSPANADILGVWRAKMDGLPFVTLTVTDEGGELAGAILFYLVTRHEGKPPSSSP
jgi:hypothetical protein